MKILVIGSKGMLGTDLIEKLSKTDSKVIGWDIEDIDITKKDNHSKIEEEHLDIIINCAAYTLVDKAETEKNKCRDINVVGVKNLVDICKKLGIIFIHISTDYVFNGSKESYNEDDEKDPINYYGKTKAEGEDIIIKNLDKYYILRTSWLFGKNGRNFVDIIIKLCNEKEEIKVVNDQIGKPTYTKDLSEGIINIVNNIDRCEYGIYHLTNNNVCSWFDFAEEIAKLIKTNCVIKPCKTEEFPTPAKRPKFSALNNNKTNKLRNWKEALREYLE